MCIMDGIFLVSSDPASPPSQTQFKTGGRGNTLIVMTLDAFHLSVALIDFATRKTFHIFCSSSEKCSPVWIIISIACHGIQIAKPVKEIVENMSFWGVNNAVNYSVCFSQSFWTYAPTFSSPNFVISLSLPFPIQAFPVQRAASAESSPQQQHKEKPKQLVPTPSRERHEFDKYHSNRWKILSKPKAIGKIMNRSLNDQIYLT